MKLIQGDCLEEMPKLTGINAVITDPPYDLNAEEKEKLINTLIELCDGSIVVFCPPENILFQNPKHWHFWIKPISTKNTSKNPSRFVEIIQVMQPHVWNIGRHWSQYTNVHTDIVETTKLHPYSKPEALITRLIMNYTKEGDTVLDPYMGSGITGVVCARTGRNFIGIEKVPDYFEIAQNQISSIQLKLPI